MCIDDLTTELWELRASEPGGEAGGTEVEAQESRGNTLAWHGDAYIIPALETKVI